MPVDHHLLGGPECHRIHPPAAPLSPPAPQLVDQHLAHGAAGDREKVLAVGERQRLGLRQADVGLADQRGGVEAGRPAELAALAVGGETQVAVEQLDELVERRRLAAAQPAERRP